MDFNIFLICDRQTKTELSVVRFHNVLWVYGMA